MKKCVVLRPLEDQKKMQEPARMEQVRLRAENQSRMDDAARISAEKRAQCVNSAIAASDDKCVWDCVSHASI